MNIVRSHGPQTDRRALGNRILRWTPRLAVSGWAAFWAWFVAVDGFASLREGRSEVIPIMGAWFAALGALTAVVWVWPRIGGTLMIAAGIGAGIYFNNGWAQALLALPAVLIGLVALLMPQAGRMPR